MSEQGGALGKGPSAVPWQRCFPCAHRDLQVNILFQKDVCVVSGMKSDERDPDLELLSMYTPGQQEFFHGLCREHVLHCDWCALLCTEGFKQLV